MSEPPTSEPPAEPPALAWFDDPKIARLMARMTWIVLVASFVLLTRFVVPDPTVLQAAVAVLLAVVTLLNLPVVNGLWHIRAQSHTAAYRAVLAGLLMRIVATVGVAVFVTS